MKGFLVFIDSQDQLASEFEIKTLPILIGREQPCEIILPYNGISRVHAEIFERDNELWIADKGSSNGIEVRGEKVMETKLNEMDPVTLGELRLEYRSPSFEERTFIASRKDIKVNQPKVDLSEHTAIVHKKDDDDDLFDAKTVIRPANLVSNKPGIPGGTLPNPTPQPPPSFQVAKPTSNTPNFSFDLKMPEFNRPLPPPSSTVGSGTGSSIKLGNVPMAPPASAKAPPKMPTSNAVPPPHGSQAPSWATPSAGAPAAPPVEPLDAKTNADAKNFDEDTSPKFQPLPEDVSLADMRESKVGKQMPERLNQASYNKAATNPSTDLFEGKNKAASKKRFAPALVLMSAVGIAAYVFFFRGESPTTILSAEKKAISAALEAVHETKTDSEELSSVQSETSINPTPAAATRSNSIPSASGDSVQSLMGALEKSFQKTQTEVRNR